MKRIAVIGSRNFNDYALLKETLSKQNNIELIISGGANGADKLSEKFALEHDIPTKIFLPNYAKYGKGAPLKRNEEIVLSCDKLIAFWDGKSRGTKNALDLCDKYSKRKEVITFSPDKIKTNSVRVHH